ncbi:erythroblast NAD(P)(+)--arginine ADP-ribosyltransferase-like [Polyodon spathula]|uniref:erythroblast NAD(P)(+)--arginine ADP-ribosyltransferase-like n=1 Tax=Polyodon spathula TaxID=7913 RepID=UPI001B7E875E|nr:erythroblast NAD(P)(+)--arginine ADP-ribosyltransferase-like [Polyodon spathula]XP_041091739.1 erythroblast NAD(P)(+)--arginine ADP-ribosyltransferase-like [Polyodon spathula]
MKILLPSILILSAVFLLQFPQIQCFKAAIPMDLAENSLDDQYVRCESKMLKLVKEKYLPSELQNTPNFKNVWETAKKSMVKKKRMPLNLEQATAIYAYTMDVYNTFNEKVRNGGKHYKAFPFKSLHFYLTDALKTLRSKQSKCYDVFRGVQDPFTANEGAIVRFGQFASTSLVKRVAENFGNGTLFAIKTCLGVPIEEYSDNQSEKEVLIPPFEKFKVLKVYGNQIHLARIPDKKSNSNCLGVPKECSCREGLCCIS